MAEQDDAPEGWRVPFRRTALVALALPLVLLAALLGTGWSYRHTIRPETLFHVTPQPAPGLETRINVSGNDPLTPYRAPSTDRGLAAAKTRVATEGLPGWSGNAR